MDAFIKAVDDARRELTRAEGKEVSVRELIRRAGFDESKRSGVAYHLNPNVERPTGHKVPTDIVEKLAAVLPISLGDLMKAAQVAAGFQVRGEAAPDLGYEVARYLGSAEVTEDDKELLRRRLQEIIGGNVATPSGISSGQADTGK